MNRAFNKVGSVALWLLLALMLLYAGPARAQISSSASVDFTIRSYSQDSTSGAPYAGLELQVNPDTIEPFDFFATVDSVVDSLHVRLRLTGEVGGVRMNDTSTVWTTKQQFLPWAGITGVRDSIVAVQLYNTRPLTADEQLRVQSKPIEPTIYAQQATNTDTIGGVADTLVLPLITAERPNHTWFFTLTAAADDSCTAAVGYRLRYGLGRAGPGDELMVVLDTVKVASGSTAFVSLTLPPVGGVFPAAWGVEASGHDVVITEFTAVSRDD